MSLHDDIRESLTRGVPRALILEEFYDAGGEPAPMGEVLRVVAWGRGKRGISYQAYGWDKLPEDGEFYIVSQGETSWAIPVSLEHTKLLKVSDHTVTSLVEMVQSFIESLDIGYLDDEELERNLWGDEPEGGW